MRHGIGWRVLLTAILVPSLLYAGYRLDATGPTTLPFAFGLDFIGTHTAIVRATPPDALRVGDRIDLAALGPAARIALARTTIVSSLPPQRSYPFTVQSDRTPGGLATLTVHVRRFADYGPGHWAVIPYLCMLGINALLALWRGRDRAAMGLALWAAAFQLGVVLSFVPADGVFGLVILLAANALFLLARVGFYVMAESLGANVLTPTARRLWRAAFGALLAVGAVQSLGGPLMFVFSGWSLLLQPRSAVLMSVSYLAPVALLFAAYRSAASAPRLRLQLRWMLASSVLLVASIFLINTPLLGGYVSVMAARLMFVVATAGLLYAVLRHRMIDVSVVLNHTLVYAATTSLVLGLFALFESQIERIAMGERTSLLLELLVPLALGASLTTVHRRIDALVERLVFRRQYLQESELRRFAREAAFVSAPDSLLELTVTQMQRHIGAPWVSLYESTPHGYAQTSHSGDHALPALIDADDPAVIALRAHESEVDLHGRASDLGPEGYSFPLQVRSQLLGFLVVGPRPGEQYSGEERELFAHVAHEVGAALFAIRAQLSEQHLIHARLREAALLEALRARGLPQPG